MPQVLVNVRAKVNNAAIRKETRNGRAVIIVPSRTLPDDVVMNDGLYPAEEISNSYKGLERTHAPLGHPVLNGTWVAAADPEAVANFGVGAWNENVRRENGIVHMDKVIDEQVANSTERGRELLRAIEANKPIHSSTGLRLTKIIRNGKNSKGKAYTWVANKMHFDHDAILLNEMGAATPDDGVGLLVNGEQTEVMNVDLPDEWVDSIADHIMGAIDSQERRERAITFREKIAEFVRTLSGEKTVVSNTHEEGVMSEIKREEFDALKGDVAKLVANSEKTAEGIATAVNAAIKPLLDQVEASNAAQKAKDEAEKVGLVERIVKANVLDKETAEELTLNALRKMGEKCKPGAAAPVSGSWAGNQGAKDEFESYDMNAAIVAATKESSNA